MPTATSRVASFSPNSPIPIPATKVKPTRPASGDRPNRIAHVPPVNPPCDSSWPANVCPRSTRKNPTVPASTAASPEATKAVRIKSYSNMAVGMVIVAMRVALDVAAARHDVIAIPDAHDFDLSAIEAREHGSGDDVVDRPDHGLTPAKIEDPVNCIDQGIELMGAEQDGDLEVVANAPGDIDHALLMRGVKRDQRLVHHDEAWLADQSLAQQHELALAARQFADRAAGKLARAHFIESPVDLAPRRLVERDEAKPGADRRGGDDVPAR